MSKYQHYSLMSMLWLIVMMIQLAEHGRDFLSTGALVICLWCGVMSMLAARNELKSKRNGVEQPEVRP